jgi:hypothetical protein
MGDSGGRRAGNSRRAELNVEIRMKGVTNDEFAFGPRR